jgi:hypothetical protein
MYNSSLRHKHDPVLSPLKMKGIRLLFFAGVEVEEYKIQKFKRIFSFSVLLEKSSLYLKGA